MYHKIPGNGFMKCMPQSRVCVQWQAWDHGSQVNNGSCVWENWSRNGWVSTVITDTCYFNTVELWVFVCRWDWGKFCWFCVANGVANSQMTCVAGCGRIAVREELVVLVCSLRREWKWISVKTQHTNHWTEQACVVVGATEVEFSENIRSCKGNCFLADESRGILTVFIFDSKCTCWVSTSERVFVQKKKKLNKSLFNIS